MGDTYRPNCIITVETSGCDAAALYIPTSVNLVFALLLTNNYLIQEIIY
jgi:hypothetical protein